MLQQLWQIAKLGFWLGSTIFGGVTQAYPVIREQAPSLGPITGEEVDGLYTLAVFLPGPSFMNLWGAVCTRAAGFAGALVGQVALLLPSFLLVLALPLLAHLPFVGDRAPGAIAGAAWATIGLLLATGIESVRKLKLAWHKVAAAVALAALLAGVSPVLLLVISIAWGAASGYLLSERKAA